MKWSYLKAIIAMLFCAACFLAAAAAGIHMIMVKYRLHGSLSHATHSQLMLAMRMDQATTYRDVPTMLFLSCAGIICGVLAIRFYNHAKSEYGG